MPASYFTMWGLLFLLALGAAGDIAVHGGVGGSLRAAYPSDLAKRDALNRCGDMDAEFSRFSGRDRENCYRAVLPASSAVRSDAASGM
jgi:hypothetical protein